MTEILIIVALGVVAVIAVGSYTLIYYTGRRLAQDVSRFANERMSRHEQAMERALVQHAHLTEATVKALGNQVGGRPKELVERELSMAETRLGMEREIHDIDKQMRAAQKLMMLDKMERRSGNGVPHIVDPEA